MVAHVGFGQPVCGRLGDVLELGAKALGIKTIRGGTYLAMEGPQFSTRAESLLYKSWGCDVIGMTNMPEAKLAREAEIRYATIGMVTDFDCYKIKHLDVNINNIILTLKKNTEIAKKVIDVIIKTFNLNIDSSDPIQTCLDSAIVSI